MQFAGTSIISFTFYKVQHYFLWVFYASCWVYIIFTWGPWWPLFLMYNQHVEYFKINLLPGFPHTHTHTHALCFLYGTHYWCLVMLLWSIYAENLEIVENFGCRCLKSFIIICYFYNIFCQVSLNSLFFQWFAWAYLVEMLLLRYFCFWLIEWVFRFGVGIVGLITATFVYVKWGIC